VQLVGRAETRPPPKGVSPPPPMHAVWSRVSASDTWWEAFLTRGEEAAHPARVARRAELTRCDPEAIRLLVGELLQWATQAELTRCRSSSVLSKTMALWALLLRGETDTHQVDWMVAQLKALGAALGETTEEQSAGAPLEALALAAVERARELGEATGTGSNGGTCDGPAFRAVEAAMLSVQLASEAGRALLVRGWAVMLSLPTTGGRTDELTRLFAAAESDEMVEWLERGPDARRAVPLEAELATALVDGPHRWAALQWLSASHACTRPPRAALGALATLSVRAAVASGALGSALALFDRHQDAPESCGRFVEALSHHAHGAQHLPQALEWLAPIAPQKAANLYPSLLALHPTAHMGALLDLCETRGVRLPQLTPPVVTAAAARLRRSSLPEARVQAAHALAALRDVEAMREMAADSCAAVVAVARHALLAWGELEASSAPKPKRQLSGAGAGARPPPASRSSSVGGGSSSAAMGEADGMDSASEPEMLFDEDD
jgi:hypothetical protein